MPSSASEGSQVRASLYAGNPSPQLRCRMVEGVDIGDPTRDGAGGQQVKPQGSIRVPGGGDAILKLAYLVRNNWQMPASNKHSNDKANLSHHNNEIIEKCLGAHWAYQKEKQIDLGQKDRASTLQSQES